MSALLDLLLQTVPREQPWKFQVTCPATKESMYLGMDETGEYLDKLVEAAKPQEVTA